MRFVCHVFQCGLTRFPEGSPVWILLPCGLWSESATHSGHGSESRDSNLWLGLPVGLPIPSRWWNITYFLVVSPGKFGGEMIQVWRLHIFFRWVVSNTITRVLSCCFCDRVLLLMANISRKLMGFSHCFAGVYCCLYSPGGVSWMSSNYEAKLGVQITRHKPVSKAPVVLALYIVRRAYEGPTTHDPLQQEKSARRRRVLKFLFGTCIPWPSPVSKRNLDSITLAFRTCRRANTQGCLVGFGRLFILVPGTLGLVFWILMVRCHFYIYEFRHVLQY